VRSGEDADRRLYSYIDRIDETRHERGWRAEATNYLGLGWREVDATARSERWACVGLPGRYLGQGTQPGRPSAVWGLQIFRLFWYILKTEAEPKNRHFGSVKKCLLLRVGVVRSLFGRRPHDDEVMRCTSVFEIG
jgi:hypothetical protein